MCIRDRLRSDGAIFLCIIGYYIVGYILVYLTIARRMPEKGKYYIGPRQMTSAILFLLAFETVSYTHLADKDDCLTFGINFGSQQRGKF